MANIIKLSPSCRLCRREGDKLFLKGDRCHTSKCALVKRKFPPGSTGTTRPARLTQYGQQLRAKQKAKRIYGVMERQFRNYYKKATAKSEDTELALKKLLEMRFDNVIYRMGLAASRSQAKQMISHGHFAINGKKLDIPSYEVNVGDEVSLCAKGAKHKGLQNLGEKLKRQHLPSWLSFDLSESTGKVLGFPIARDLEGLFDSKQIVEYYSRF